MYALIMGSSGDIGTSSAKNLAAKGWSLYLHYNKNSERIEKLRAQLVEKYPKQDFIPIKFDMEHDKVEDLTKQIFGLDAVVFAQGNTYYKLLVDISESEIDSLWNIHVKLPILIFNLS